MSEILSRITKHWLTQASGWRTLDHQAAYPYADLVAVNESGDVLLVVCADDGSIHSGFFSALGRLILMMDRDFEVNTFGMPRRDPSLDPPLIRYALAVPAGETWLRLVRAVPDRVRKILHLIILRVSRDDVVRYDPGVAI